MSTTSLLATPPKLTHYAAQQWVLHCPSGHDLLLNHATVKLLGLLDVAPTMEAGRAAFNTSFEAALSPGEFEALLRQQLGGYQVLAHDDVPVRPALKGPLHQQLELLPARVAGWLARPLTSLYRPLVFWPMLAGISLALGSLIRVVPVPNVVPASAGALALFYFSVPVHELGHIAACRRAGVAHGGIGVGVYYFFPLLYADITGIWQADRQARIIANLGGIFSQLLYAGGLAIAAQLLHQGAVLVVAEAVAISAAWQLNPFLQHDGYWVLSDLSNTPNLLSRAKGLRQRLLTRAGLRRLWARPLAERARDRRSWVLLYGLLNTSLLLTFIGYALYHSRQVLPQLPALGHTILSKLFQGTLTLADLPGQALTVLAVYGWLLRMVVGKLFQARRRPAAAPGLVAVAGITGGRRPLSLTSPAYLLPMNNTQTPTATLVAQQFQTEALAPRTEIWSKDIERSTPSGPNGLTDCN